MVGERDLHAVLWDKGEVIDLGTLGGGRSKPNGINPAGQVVGFSTTEGNTAYHAFVWEKGVMTDLGTLGGSNSEARGISPAGQVVGNSLTPTDQAHATLWTRK